MLLEDPERICDECRKCSSSCLWPKMKARSACTRCADKHIKCKIDGVLVSNRAQRQMGPSLSKRRRMTTPEILEMVSETAEVRKTPNCPEGNRHGGQWLMRWRIWCGSRGGYGSQWNGRKNSWRSWPPIPMSSQMKWTCSCKGSIS